MKDDTISYIKNISYTVREQILAKFGDTSGKCIEASDMIAGILNSRGIKAEAKRVYVLYEKFENCYYYCYEEHWLVKCLVNGRTYYVDTTMDQFQWAFNKKLPEIYFGNTLPKFYLSRKPGKCTLEKCGWNDWLEYGNYENNFSYY